MNKETYLTELSKLIKKLPKQEQEDLLSDYNDHFEQARMSGRTERDIIEGLGEPQLIAKDILVQYEITNAQENPSLNNVTKAVFAALGLGFLNMLFILGPFFLGLALLAMFFVIAILFLASPILLLIQDGFTLTYIKEFLASVGLVGIGLLVLLGALRIAAFYYRYMIIYLNFNLKLVRRKSR